MKESVLRPLIEQATAARDSAAIALASSQADYQRGQTQLEALLNYRDEYQNRLTRAMSNGITLRKLANDQRFIADLDDAIEQQKRQLAATERSVANKREGWQERQRRLQSFDTLAERSRRNAEQANNRREQRLTDEAAGRLARRALD